MASLLNISKIYLTTLLFRMVSTMAKTIKLCDISVDISNRLSDKGKMLKSMFMIGPSKAVMQNGKIFDSGFNTDQYNSQTTSNNNKYKLDVGDDNNTGNQQHVAVTTSDSLIYNHSYSILEAYSNMRFIYEDSGSENGIDSILTRAVNKANSDKEDYNDSFKPGDKYTFKVELPEEGYTLWTVVFDKRCANKSSAISAIQSKKFKSAFNIASKGLESDGLVPISIQTYVVDKSDGSALPPFIGHCRYGFDSGSVEETNEDSRTLCLAIAPIIGNTNKPNQNYVIQAIYDVVGDITGGAIGNLSRKLKSNKDNDYGSRYNDDNDSESEQSISDELSSFIKSKFKAVGDHTMYSDFRVIKKWIEGQIKAKNLKFSKATSTQLKDFATSLKNKPVYF